MNEHGVRPHIYPAILTRNDTIDRPEREWAKDVWRTTVPLPTPTSKVVVVFNEENASAGESSYMNDIIRANLSKHNVVIQIVRDIACAAAISTTSNTRHLTKYWPTPSMPLFIPRVDECYYRPYQYNRESYDTAREVLSIIDLWKNHEEMILYVVKNADADADADADAVSLNYDDESGTEGFDDEDHIVRDINTSHKTMFDYVRIFEDYHHSTHHERSKRKLVIMF